MAIKEYAAKSSVLKHKSRYIQGGATDIDKKRLGWWERFNDIPRDDITDIPVYIDATFDRRPDLVADKYYGDATLEWIVLQYNSIVDTVEEFVVGKTITIPSKDRVYFDILVNSIRVQESNL